MYTEVELRYKLLRYEILKISCNCNVRSNVRRVISAALVYRTMNRTIQVLK